VHCASAFVSFAQKKGNLVLEYGKFGFCDYSQ
jgi:hypothetical protein